MAYEASNCSKDMSGNDFLDFNGTIFDALDFHNSQDALTLSRGNGPLNTLELPRLDSSASSTGESHNDQFDGLRTSTSGEHDSAVVDKELLESTVPLEGSDEYIINLLLDIEANASGVYNNCHQPVTTDAQQSIEVIENELREAADEISDKIDLRAALTAIQRSPHAAIRIGVKPAARQRFRYRIDGRRYVKGSRSNPMSIKLPRLNGCLAKAYQSFWIQLTLVTTRRNPRQKVFRHQHKMSYTGEGARQNGSGSFRIPLTNAEIHQRVKTFRHLSIVKTKLSEYNFELVPFDPLIVDDHVEYYTLDGEDEMTKVQKSKRFDAAYHTEEFRIVCQLIIKQKDQWHPTDLSCETPIITDG